MLNDGPENQGNTTTKSSPDQSSFGVTYGSVPIANLPGVAPEKDLTTEDHGNDYRELYSLRKKLNKKLLTIIGVIILILLLLIGSVWVLSSRKKETPTSSNNQTLSSDGLSLTDPRLDGTGTLDPSRKLEVNSRLVANNSIILTPINQPDTPQLGQIFLNKNDSKLYFYNGQRFVEIASASTASAAGLQGPAGANGIQGPRGLNGINGSNGANGAKGDQGDTGPQGPAGVGSCPYGDCVSLQVGSPGTQEVGNLNVSGVIIAGSFSGNGSALTNVNAATLNGQAGSYYTNATNLTSGTVSDARLSPNVTLQGNTFNGMSQLVQTTAGGALPVISGANLTSLNATNISSGTLSDARLSTNVTVQGNTFNGVNQLVQLNGSGFLPALNGSLLTNVDAATLNGQAGSYYTNATNISSGTLNDARLSSNVTLQGNTFNGASQLIQLNASTELPAVSGANLTNLNGSSISSGTVSNTYLTGSGALTVTAGNGLINGGSVALGSSVTLNVGAGDGITVNANDIAVDSTVCRTSNNCTAVGAASGDLTGNYPGPTIASLQGKTLTVSGTPTTGAVLQYNGSAFVDGLIANGNLAAGTFTNITGVGALTAGSIGGSFGNINIGSNTFTGNGSGLTNVDAATLGGQAGSYYTNASNISSGTLNDLRLSSNVTLQGNTFNGASQLVQTTVGGALPTLSGINLTNLNASNIASGTLNDLRLSSNVTLQGNTFNGISQLVQLDGSGYLPALNASLLTAINASNIASGTLSDSRLSANVALLNQANTFTALLTANAGITLLTGQNLTINGDVISDLTGTGLTVSGGALTVDATSGTGFFRNGGNSFGAAATLGTNDVNVLNLETNNTNRFQISSNSSKLTGQGNTEIDSTGALFIGGNGSNGIAIGNSSVSSNQIAIGGSPNVDYINLQSTSSIAVIANDTTVVSQNDSVTAFQVQNSLAESLLNVDATTASVVVGGSSVNSATALAVQNSSAQAIFRVNNITNGVTVGGVTNSSTAFQVQSSSGTNLLNADTTNMRLSVGSIGTSVGQLYVSGSIGSGSAGSVSLGIGSYTSVIVKGSYAYTVDYGGNTLQIADISNSPSGMTAKGTVTGSGSVLYGLAVEGRYAYSTDIYAGSILVFDVSDPSNPVEVANKVVATDLGSSYFSGKQSIIVQGRYAYVVSPSDSTLVIVDIANPANPVVAGTFSYGSTGATALAVQGDYLYIVDSGNNALDIFNISNKTSPVLITSFGLSGTLPTALAVSDNYVYIVNLGAPALFRIYDVSNPASPSLAGSVSTGTSGASVSVSGRYAYIGTISNGLRTVNISNPASPSLIGSASGSITDVDIKGRYAYAVNGNTDLYAYDLGGAYIQELEVGGIAASAISVSGNTNIGGNLSVQGGVSIQGSTQMTGDLAVNGTAMFRNMADSTSAFQIQNASGNQIINVDTSVSSNNLITNPSFEGTDTVWNNGSRTTAERYIGNYSYAVPTFGSPIYAWQEVPSLASNTMYKLTFYIKDGSGDYDTFTSMVAGYNEDGLDTNCMSSQTVSAFGWTKFSCTFTTTTVSNPTPFIYIGQSSSDDRTFYIDGVQLIEINEPANLITNPDFESGTTGWGSYSSGTFTQSSNAAHSGTYSLRVVSGTGSESGVTYQMSFNPSTKYTIKAYAKLDSSSAPSSRRFSLGHVTDNGQTPTSNVGCSIDTPNASEWKLFTCTFTTAASLRSSPYITFVSNEASSASTIVYLDDVSMYEGDDAGNNNPQFDQARISLNGIIDSPAVFRARNNSNTAFIIQGTNTGYNLFTADTVNSRIAIGKNTADYTLDVEGVINSSAAVRTPVVTSGSTLTLQSATTSAITLDSGTTGAVNIGTGANAKTVTIGNAIGATSVVVNCGTGACSFGANATAHTTTIGSLTGAATTTIQGGTGGVSLGSSGVANTIQIGNTTGAVSQTINIGNNATASSTNNVNIGSTVAGTTAIAGPTTITGRTSGSSSTLIVDNSTSTGAIFIARDNGTPVLTVANNGGATFKTVTNTANAFKTTNSNNDILLNVGTAHSLSEYTNLINNSSFESGSTGWTGKAGGSTGSGSGSGSVTGISYMSISMDAAGEGAYYPVTLSANTDYTLSVYARTNWGAMNTLVMGHQDQFGTDIDDCVLSSETIDADWRRVSCSFTTGATISSSNVYIRQSDGTNRSVEYDAAQLQASPVLNAYNMGEVYFNAPINQNLIVTGNGYTGGTDLTFQVQDSTGALQFGVSGAGQVTVENDLAVNGGDFTSTATTFNFLQSTVDTLNIGGAVGSGGINLAGGSGSTGCTIQGAVGSLTCSGNITSTATSGIQGWWSRTGTTLQPANSGDNITTSGNISTTGSGTITSAGNFIANGTSLFQNQTNSTTALQVQNSSGEQLITVDTLTTNNLVSNGNFEANTTGWAAKGGATLSQTTSQHALGTGSMQVTTTAAANDGAKYNYALASQTSYTITAYVKATTNTAATTTISLGFTQDGSTDTNCATNQTILGSGWSKLTCNFTTSNVTGTNNIYIKQSDATNRTIYIDSVQLESRSTLNANTDFEVNSSGWGSYSAAAVAQSALQAYIGTGSLQVVTSSTSGSSEGAVINDSFQPNTTYSASYMIWLDSASAPSKSFSIIKRADPSDNAVGSTCGSSLVVTADTWTNISCTFTTRSTVANSPFIGIVTTDSGDTVTQYTFYIDNAVVAPIKHSSNDIGRININAAISSPLTLLGPDSTTAFQIQSINSSTNLFTADTTNSRIGIGTNTPTHNLTVVGDALFRLGTSTTGSSVFDTFNIQTTTGANAFSVNNSRAVVIGVNSGTTNASLSTYGSGLFKTMTNSSAAFRIQDAAGNNVVNVSTSTGQKALTVGSNNAAGEFIIVDNNSTPVFEIDSTTGSATLSASLNSYDFLDETATPVLGICSSGVTVGSAGSCAGSYLLDVGGDINVSSGSVYRINGTDINTAGTLSNVAYLNGTGPQTFTGNNSFTGTILHQNSSNSTAAFQIQNSSSTPLLVADTTNSRLYIGNPSADSTGAILVLDTKNTSGDPTGVDGAMYYNSDSKSFRCYSNGSWRSCASGVVFANTSLPGGNTVASTAAETDFASNYSIPANDCQPGRVYKVTAQGVWSNGGGGTNTLRWKVKLGSTTIGDTNTQTVATGVTDESWRVEFNFICQTTGGSGTIEAQGYLTGWTSAVNSANWTMKNTGTVTIDTTTSQTLQMSVQHDSSSAGKSATLRQFIVEATGP